MKTTTKLTPEHLQTYCKATFNKSWTLEECKQAIDLAIRRGAVKSQAILRDAVNFLYA